MTRKAYSSFSVGPVITPVFGVTYALASLDKKDNNSILWFDEKGLCLGYKNFRSGLYCSFVNIEIKEGGKTFFCYEQRAPELRELNVVADSGIYKCLSVRRRTFNFTRTEREYIEHLLEKAKP